MSDKLIEEMEGVKGASSITWLNEPYVGLVQVKEIKLSEEAQGYTGSPYFRFLIRTADGRQSNITFWREIAGDDPKKNETKKGKLKSFLENCEADATKKGMEYLKSAIGKKLNMVLKKREFVLKASGDKPPRIDTDIIYSFSAKRAEPIEIQNLSQLHIHLSEEDRKKFQAECDAYNKKDAAPKEKTALENAQGAGMKTDAPVTETNTQQQEEKKSPENEEDIPF